MADQGRTIETRVLDHYPDVRRSVVESSAFTAWRRGLKALDIDGEIFYLRGGDILRDEDQLIFEWARKTGALTDAAIEAALSAEEGDGRAT